MFKKVLTNLFFLSKTGKSGQNTIKIVLFSKSEKWRYAKWHYPKSKGI